MGAAPVALGQSVTVLLPGPETPPALMLPLTALFEHQGKSQVWVLDRTTMTVQMRAVQPVAIQANLIVLGAGLSPGESVVTAGVHTLSPGQKVSLYAEPKQ
jgi:multidrug efflux pump subunit AcrA (membrane-fusion protein)